MKKSVVVVAMMMIAWGVRAQDNSISKFFSKYQNDDSFSLVNISGKMFSMMANIEGSTVEDKAMISAISKIRGLKILRKEQARNSRELYQEAISAIPTNDYEELMSVRDKDKDMKFYTKESGGKISDLVMIMGGNEEFMVLSIFGDIDLKEMSRIGKSVNIDGLKNLDKIKEDKKTKKN
jgi:hypothetical protein